MKAPCSPSTHHAALRSAAGRWPPRNGSVAGFRAGFRIIEAVLEGFDPAMHSRGLCPQDFTSEGFDC